MPELSYPSELIRLVAKELKGVAPTGLEETDLHRHGDARRYTWVPQDSSINGPRRGGTLDSMDLRFAVECWGGNFDDAWWMVCALLAAIQKALGGRNYEATTLRPGAQRLVNRGFVWTLEVVLRLHIPVVDLTQPPPVSTSKSALEGPPPAAPVYAPTGETTVQITGVAQATPATSTPGDGVLESEET